MPRETWAWSPGSQVQGESQRHLRPPRGAQGTHRLGGPAVSELILILQNKPGAISSSFKHKEELYLKVDLTVEQAGTSFGANSLKVS